MTSPVWTVPIGGKRADHSGPFPGGGVRVSLCAASRRTHFEFDVTCYSVSIRTALTSGIKARVAGSAFATHAAGIMGAAAARPGAVRVGHRQTLPAHFRRPHAGNIPALIILGIVQAEIRRQVNNGWGQGCELLDFMLGGSMR